MKNPWSILNGYGGERVIGLRPSAVKIFGASAGILLSQFLYWQQRTKISGDWFYNTQTELEEQTGLSDTEQLTARKKLKTMGVLEEERKGIPAKLFYRLDLQKIVELFELQHIPTDRNRSEKGQFVQNQDSHDVGICTPTSWESGLSVTWESSKEIPKEIIHIPPTPKTEIDSDTLEEFQEPNQEPSEFVEKEITQTESTQTQVQNPIALPAAFDYSSVEKILENRPACFAERDALYLHCKNLLPNLEDKTFFRLFNILCSPAQFSYNRKNYKQAFLRLEFWLTELQPKFIDEVLNIARDGDNRTSNGYAMWMLNNPADACQKHPELEPLRRASGLPARVIPKIVKLKPIDEQVFETGEAWG